MSELSATGGRDVHRVPFPADPPPAAVDVLIVGAGPVGLAAAVELTGRGVRVAVVDRAREATLVRAGAMGHTPRVVEHLRRWGLLQQVRAGWTSPPEWNRGIRLVTSLAGHELVAAPVPAFSAPGGHAATTSVEALRRPQTVFQHVFLERLRERGVPVSGGWELRSLTQDEDGVDVGVAPAGDDADGVPRTIRASWVVAADGGPSTTRRLAGIAREGAYATEKRVRLIVRTGDLPPSLGPAPSATNIVLNHGASGFLAAVSTREWRVYAGPYPLDHEPTEDELLTVARAAFGTDLDLELASATTFYEATRIAETFRRGRVLLAGDAAHVRTPGGNLGEGIGDVVNLGWKLAAVLAGHAPHTLLDSYDQERRRHNHRVAAHALDRARRSRTAVAEIRQGGIPDDADLSAAAELRRAEIAERLRRDQRPSPGVTFDERYDASDVVWYEPGQPDSERPWRPEVYEDDPRPGHRAPDGVVDPYGLTLHDRIGSAFALLVLAGGPEDRAVHGEPNPPSVEGEFAHEAVARGLPLTVVHLADPAARAVYGTPYVLVRPDQHVAWRGTGLPSGGAAEVLDKVLGHRAGTAPAGRRATVLSPRRTERREPRTADLTGKAATP
ncbi:FAD-dependent oxidoreductase [Streptomyces sp. NPDC090306]|uniref:FAD-dependent oxidoreductase n=1 Tax=Streptomyces sp. NPDC090306 TaxID=3365961 RepID=UPI003820E220